MLDGRSNFKVFDYDYRCLAFNTLILHFDSLNRMCITTVIMFPSNEVGIDVKTSVNYVRDISLLSNHFTP